MKRIKKNSKEALVSAAKDGQLVKQSGTYGPKAYLDQWFVKSVPSGKDVKPGMVPQEATQDGSAPLNTDKDVQQLIVENPKMNVATFFNLLKSKGFTITKGSEVVAPVTTQTEEADSSGSFPQSVRAGVKKTESIKMRSFRFMEASSPQDKTVGYTRFKVVLLQEGLGNLRDSFFYTRQALESAVTVFEGKKIYADHPSSIDEAVRPERSVKDILGHFENVHIEESSDGTAMLVGEVKILPDEPYLWARSLMGTAVQFSEKYPDKEFIGLSINANGDAEDMPIQEFLSSGIPSEGSILKIKKAMAEGVSQVGVVTTITDATSCDLVTEAGAGGKVLEMLESNKNKEAQVAKNENEKVKKEGEDAPGATPGHADAGADMQLIKDMLKKHAGELNDPSEEECAYAKEAYESAIEMGAKENEAMKQAVSHMKMTKHMAAKKEKHAQAEAEKAAAVEAEKKAEAVGSATPGGSKPEHVEAFPPKKDDDADDEKKKESFAKLQAEVVTLREKVRGTEVAEHIEKTIKESKRGNIYTDGFRAYLKECGAKSVEDVNRSWKLFEHAYTAHKSTKPTFDFTTVEKAPAVGMTGKKFDFSGAAKD
jgi:hypothetical protein